MPESYTVTSKKNHVRTSSRSQGVRLTKEQTQEAQDKFLKAFASNGNVRAACMSAGIDRQTVYRWSEHDEQFAMKYNLAKADVDDAIRAEIYRRGMFGEERFVVAQGKIVYGPDNPDGTRGKPLTYKEKSDTLLIFHAKSRMPEYRDKQQVELTGNNGGPVQFQHLSTLTEQELDTLERIAREAQEREQASGR
jgi:hypothetical protein